MEPIQEGILNALKGTSVLKQKVYDRTLAAMSNIKLILQELESELKEDLKNSDPRILPEYSDRGRFEAQLKAGSDVLVFSMHSNVFEFNREHSIWKTSYVQDNKLNSYCGIINIFNFLSDSFKYNRMEDLGYLIGRIFINQEDHFIVEGKRQFGFLYNNFGKDTLNKENLRVIIQNSLQYSLEFDLLVPPYDAVKIVTVGQMTQKIEDSRIITGKRLGFTFNSDDVAQE
jgi:hypothetical protein